MTTYTDAEVALAVRGALYLEWHRDDEGWWNEWGFVVPEDCLLCECAEFFVALLDKCRNLEMRVSLEEYPLSRESVVTIGIIDRGQGVHPNRTLALLLALDAAKPDGWPKEDARG